MPEEQTGTDAVTTAPDAGSADTPDVGTFKFSSQNAPPDITPFIPEEYKEKEWVKNIMKSENPRAEFFKQHEHAQSLIGKQQARMIPGDDATPDQIAAYRKAIDVPDTVDGYEFTTTEWKAEHKEIGEQVVASRNPDMVKHLKEVAHREGMSKKQLNAMVQAYEQKFVELNHGALMEARQTAEQESQAFDTQARALYGNRAEEVIQTGAKRLAAIVPPQIQPLVAKLDPNALLILSAVLDRNLKAYGQEDGLSGKGGMGAALPVTQREIEAEGIRLMSDPAFSDFQDPRHAEVKAKVRENYDRLKTLKR